ncbi:MAG TPA: response regulator [Bacteroidota bacterium]|nr:response regulator [Bacteroidota bacterium]
MKTEQRKKILIVDDERLTRAVLQHDIVLAGYDVMTASNGQEAMQKIREIIPDLIVVDLVMPDMNGFEMCRKIRSYEGTKKTPVIVVSALQSQSDKEEAKTSGADLYLTKPVRAGEFVGHIKKFLGSPFKATP